MAPGTASDGAHRLPCPPLAHEPAFSTMMELLSDPNVWIAFAMLTAFEIVLGLDNLIFIFIFISILVGRLPPEQRDKARRLGLAFLVMVGMALTAEAFDQEVPKGYIYAAMAFSLAVEALNIRARTKRQLAAQAAGGH